MTLLFAALLIAAGLLIELWSLRRKTDRIHYDLITPAAPVECDEPFELTARLTNAGKLPFLFVRLSEPVPEELSVNAEENGLTLCVHTFLDRPVSHTLEQTLFLMPRESITRSVSASLSKRGHYVFSGASITFGDFLGLKERTERYELYREVVVLPKRISLNDPGHAFGNWLGDLSVRRFILPDPILTVGFREYTGCEPMRDISWQRSAQGLGLMVKQYDFTAEPNAILLFNAEGLTDDEAELCYSLVRCAAEALEKQHISFRFSSNAHLSDRTGGWHYLPEGTGTAHLNTLLEGLGRAIYGCAFPFSVLMENAGLSDDRPGGCILVTGTPDAEALAVIRRFEARTGRSVFLLTPDSCIAEAAA